MLELPALLSHIPYPWGRGPNGTVSGWETEIPRGRKMGLSSDSEKGRSMGAKST